MTLRSVVIANLKVLVELLARLILCSVIIRDLIMKFLLAAHITVLGNMINMDKYLGALRYDK